MLQRNYPTIIEFLRQRRSVMVLGPRGTGKTYFLTLTLRQFPRYRIIDLLNKEEFRRFLTNPSLLYQEIELELKRNTDQPLIMMIDEVQLLPNILDEVHRSIEAFKPDLQFLLTGSSARKLKRQDANLLAGRALRRDFFPLGLDEVDLEPNLPRILQWGTLPETWTTDNEQLRRAYLNTYVGVYLEEEVQKEAQIRNLEGFSRFLEIAAAENGQIVNYTKLAKAAGIADVTAKEYFTILTDTLLAYHVPAWTFSRREQLQLAPKYYLFDNGVINALLGELTSTPRPSTYRYGRLFENAILGQMMQFQSKNDCPASIYHYRTQAGKEIDFILQKNPHTKPIAVEIKSCESPSAADVRQLTSFKKTYPEGAAIVICPTLRPYTEDGIEFLAITEGISRAFELANE